MSQECSPGYWQHFVSPPVYYVADTQIDSQLESSLTDSASTHVSSMLFDCLNFTPIDSHLFILFDRDTHLTRILSSAYRRFIDFNCTDSSKYSYIEFGSESANDILLRIEKLQENDAVILIQSLQFRLNDYRIRIELFKRKIKTIEHVHGAIIPIVEYPQYIQALAFSPKTSGELAYSLKARVDRVSNITVECVDGSTCVWSGGMQSCKLNIGDYRESNGVGGTFPIGEVFTEAKNLKGVNGKVSIFGYPSLSKVLIVLETPIILEFVGGAVRFDPANGIEPENCTEEFRKLLTLIKDGEGDIIIREFGMGLNEGMSRTLPVQDIFAFERQYGMHISLGSKHNVYSAEGISKKKSKFHIDVFVDVKTVKADEDYLFSEGRWNQIS